VSSPRLRSVTIFSRSLAFVALVSGTDGPTPSNWRGQGRTTRSTTDSTRRVVGVKVVNPALLSSRFEFSGHIPEKLISRTGSSAHVKTPRVPDNSWRNGFLLRCARICCLEKDLAGIRSQAGTL
jgi:hypothetical protein